MPVFTVYILKTNKNTLYIGQTNNLPKRIKEHEQHTSRSAKYLNYFTTFELVYTEKFSTQSDALKREAELKKWPRKKKDMLFTKI